MNEVNIKGVIVPNDESWIYELFGIDHTSTKTVANEVEKADGGDLEVVINSGGGSVFDASEIYTELMNHKGDVKVQIVGLAASAASVIAMAGNKIEMSPTAQMMIHNASVISRGDHNDMSKIADVLKGTDKTIANAYRLKSGLEEKELLNMMAKETWLTPEDAKEKGFIDEVMFSEPYKASASLEVTSMLPQQVIDGVRNGVLKNKQKPSGVNEETLNEALSNMKQEIIDEIKTNNEPNQPVKNNWLF